MIIEYEEPEIQKKTYDSELKDEYDPRHRARWANVLKCKKTVDGKNVYDNIREAEISKDGYGSDTLAHCTTHDHECRYELAGKSKKHFDGVIIGQKPYDDGLNIEDRKYDHGNEKLPASIRVFYVSFREPELDYCFMVPWATVEKYRDKKKKQRSWVKGKWIWEYMHPIPIEEVRLFSISPEGELKEILKPWGIRDGNIVHVG